MISGMKVVLIGFTDLVTNTSYNAPVPVDITDLFEVDHVNGFVSPNDIAMIDVQSRWSGLPAEVYTRSVKELTMRIFIQYDTEGGAKGYKSMPGRTSPLTVPVAIPDMNAAYCDGGNRKDGWRKPGRNVLDKRGEAHKRKGKR
jgi:hypothetical protein